MSMNEPELRLTSSPVVNAIQNIEDDAFGDVSGGKLWYRLHIALADFPEMAFRLMIKSAFDSGQDGME